VIAPVQPVKMPAIRPIRNGSGVRAGALSHRGGRALPVGLAMLGLSLLPAALVAKPEESAYLMAPIQVNAPPFGKWGIGLNLHYRSMELSTGGPPKAIYVAWVQAGTQAHAEGIEAGDEIVAINDSAVSDLKRHEVESLLFDSSSEQRITLHLRHRLNNRPYRVDLVLLPRKPAPFQPVFWGVQVIGDEGTLVTLRHGQALQRRTAELVWGRRTLVLSEEADGGVSLTESGRRRSVPAGSALMLRADGHFEIADRPPPPRR
jgi:PDZ domain